MDSRPNSICVTVVSCPATSMPAARPIASSSVTLPSWTAALRKFQKESEPEAVLWRVHFTTLQERSRLLMSVASFPCSSTAV